MPAILHCQGRFGIVDGVFDMGVANARCQRQHRNQPVFRARPARCGPYPIARRRPDREYCRAAVCSVRPAPNYRGFRRAIVRSRAPSSSRIFSTQSQPNWANSWWVYFSRSPPPNMRRLTASKAVGDFDRTAGLFQVFVQRIRIADLRMLVLIPLTARPASSSWRRVSAALVVNSGKTVISICIQIAAEIDPIKAIFLPAGADGV